MTRSTWRPGFQGAAFALAAAFTSSGASVVSPPAWAQEAASAVQDVTLQDVVLPVGDTTLKAPTLTVSGTRLSKDDVLAILKADGPEPWAARLARLDAGSINAPELRVERKDGEVTQVMVYRDAAAKGVHAGRIDEISAASASVAMEGGPGTGKGSYGQIRAEQVDLAAMARFYGEAGDGKAPLQRLYGSFSVETIVFGDEKTSVRIANLRGRDLSGRPIPATWSGGLKALSGFDPDKAEPAERTRVSGIAADLAEAVAVGGLEATGLRLHDATGDAVEIELGRLAYAGGSDPSVELADFSIAVSGAKTKLGGLKLTGFSLAPTIATLRRLSQNAEASSAELRRLTPAIGTLTLSGLGIELPKDDEAAESKPAPSPSPADPLAKPAPGGTAPDTRADKPLSPSRLGLREAVMTFGPPKDGVPASGRFTLSGLTLPAALVASVPGLGSLAEYGYRDLDLSLVTDAAWNEEAKEIALREITLSGKDMGSIRLAGTLAGIGADVFDPDPAVSSYAMLAATAKSLDLTVQNGGLFERFIDATAKTLSLKPEELRKEYVTASVVGVPVILGNSAAAKAIGAAMGKFVVKPGTLKISAKAKNGAGLGVADLSTAVSPAAVLDKLDVNAKAE